jgi:hypothetical protein
MSYENENTKCYKFKQIIYQDGILDDAVDATYIINLEGNGRYEDVISQLTKFQPTKIVYIVFNKGYKNCEKNENITLPAHDLTDAFFQIFKHANNASQNYNNILILEDDFIFSEKIRDPSTKGNICDFLNKHKNEDFQYLLGCMPLIKMPYTFNCQHFISIVSLGTHACLYSKENRYKLLKTDQTTITDWDIYNAFNSRRYSYFEPLCYQLLPETENSKNWGENNYILYLLGIIAKWVFKIFSLDKQVEPGYSFFYIFSKIFFFIIVFSILFMLLSIIYIINVTTKNGNSQKRNKNYPK